MTTIVTRAGKGSALTHNEVDANFTNLNNAKVEADQSVTLTNKTISGSSNTLSNIGNASLTNSSVMIGSTSVSLGSTATTVSGLTLTSPTVNTPTISGGTVNNTVIGGSTPAAITGTTITANTGFSGPLNGTVGASTPDSGAFTTLSATGVTTVQAGSAAAPAITTSGDTNTGILFPAADTVAISTGGTERMRLDASGNLGLGVTPSAWSGFSALDINAVGSVAATPANQVAIVYNSYYNGTNYIYKTSNLASRYTQLAGVHQWHIAPTGTAGGTITWTQAMTLDASGNLGLGVTPSAWGSNLKAIDINTVGSVWSYVSGTNVQIGVTNNAYLNSSLAYTYKNSAAASNYLQNQGQHTWYTAASGTAGNAITFTQVLSVDLDKTLALEGATSQTGTGITFPATQAASTNANTLDDYEEGTFTPTIIGTTTAGTGTYTGQVGRYTKVGNRVLFQISVTWTAHTGTGNMRISGLPFTAANVTDVQSAVAITASNLTFSGSLSAFTVNNTSQIYLRTYATGGSEADLALDTAAFLRVSGVYEV